MRSSTDMSAGRKSFAGAMALVAAGTLLALSACGEATPLQDNRDTMATIRGFLTGSAKRPPRDDQYYEEIPDETCPKMEIKSGAGHHVIYAPGGLPEPRNIQYQGTLTKTSRECEYLADSVAIRFGFAGRLLLGPKGAPGAATLPVRAEFAGKGDVVVWTKDFQVPVTVQPGQDQELFVHVSDELVYQPKPGEDLADFRLYIGFSQIEGVAGKPRGGR